ncbi:MAG: MFS transporter [Pseudomonadota bacterium]
MAQPSSAQALTRSEVRTALTLSAAAVLRMFGLFMLLPVLSLWASELAGANAWWVGVAVSIYGLSQAALQIPFGALSDRIGRRTVVIGALILFVVGSFVAGTAEHVSQLIIGRALQGAGAVSAALTAWLADASRDGARVRVNAIFGASIGLSFALSLVLGPALASALSVRALFGCAVTFGVLAILLVATAPGAPRQRRRGNALAGALPAFREPRLRALLLAVWLLHAILIAMFVALPIQLANAGIASDAQWPLYLAALLGSLCVTLPMLRRADASGSFALAVPAWWLMAIGLALIGPVLPSALGFTLALGVFFAGFNFLEAGLPAWVSLLAPADVRGACLGAFSTAQFFGAFCGGLIGAAMLAGALPVPGLLPLAITAAVAALLLGRTLTAKRVLPVA